MKALLIVLAAFMLSGCATEPRIQIKEVINTVQVPVMVPCIHKRPERPEYGFGKGAKPSDKEMAAILAEDFERADQYGRDWEAAAAGCSITPSP